MHNVVKWPNILQKSCGVKILKYVWPFYNIMHERVNGSNSNADSSCTVDGHLFEGKP